MRANRNRTKKWDRKNQVQSDKKLVLKFDLKKQKRPAKCSDIQNNLGISN